MRQKMNINQVCSILIRSASCWRSLVFLNLLLLLLGVLKPEALFFLLWVGSELCPFNFGLASREQLRSLDLVSENGWESFFPLFFKEYYVFVYYLIDCLLTELGLSIISYLNATNFRSIFLFLPLNWGGGGGKFLSFSLPRFFNLSLTLFPGLFRNAFFKHLIPNCPNLMTPSIKWWKAPIKKTERQTMLVIASTVLSSDSLKIMKQTWITRW